MKVSIITTCKGRLHHIKQTLPLMLAQEHSAFEIIVVDYGDPDRCADVMSELYKSVKFIKVRDGTDTFSPSRARNIGGIEATGNVLAFVDGDIKLDSQWLEACVDKVECGDTLIIPGTQQSEITGTCVITAELYRTIRGYGEDLLGWGYQDHDLYNRAREAGAIVGLYSADLVSAIPNSVEERCKHYSDHRQMYTGTRNKSISKRRSTIVNPNGYGLGSTEILANGKSYKKFVAKYT